MDSSRLNLKQDNFPKSAFEIRAEMQLQVIRIQIMHNCDHMGVCDLQGLRFPATPVRLIEDLVRLYS